MKANEQNPIYAPDTLEFVTVATEFCAYLEQSASREKTSFIERMRKLLPLLYLKAQLLPEMEGVADFTPDDRVTQQDYDYILHLVAAIMGDDDYYEDATFGMEMQQTEQLCWKTVSEGLADMYQPLRNFVAAYRLGIEPCMESALYDVRYSFIYSWGTALVDTLRRFHYLTSFNSDEDNF